MFGCIAYCMYERYSSSCDKNVATMVYLVQYSNFLNLTKLNNFCDLFLINLFYKMFV